MAHEDDLDLTFNGCKHVQPRHVAASTERLSLILVASILCASFCTQKRKRIRVPGTDAGCENGQAPQIPISIRPTHSLNSSFLSLTSNQSLAVMSSPTREISVKLRCECKCHRMNPHVDAQRSKGSYQRKVASTVVSDTGYLPNNEN